MLLTEVAYKNGGDFERNSVFANLLSVTMVIDKLSLHALVDKKYACFLELRNFPHVNHGDIIACHVSADGIITFVM